MRQQQEAAPTSRVRDGSQALGSPAEARTTEESWPLLPVPEGMGEPLSSLHFSSLLLVHLSGQTYLDANRLGAGKM